MGIMKQGALVVIPNTFLFSPLCCVAEISTVYSTLCKYLSTDIFSAVLAHNFCTIDLKLDSDCEAKVLTFSLNFREFTFITA